MNNKKTYIKPTVYVEHFELNANVSAASCGSGNENAAFQELFEIGYFEASPCIFPVSSLGDEYVGICYHTVDATFLS